MNDRLDRLEATVTALAAEVTQLRTEVAQLEMSHRAGAGPEPSAAAYAIAPDVNAGMVSHWVALAGRTLVILGGAYLLRALTDAQYVPAATGVALGLVYGAPWLIMAARSGTRGAQLDAFCYGLSTALIGFPLVWEATYRFAVLSPAQSALLLVVLTAGALVLAALRRLQSLAWIVMLGGVAAAFSLAIATAAWTPYTAFAILLGVATLWLGYTHDWMLLRWPAAAVANLMLVIVTGRAVAAGSARGALLLHALLIAGYFGSFAVRTIARRRRVIPFEIGQGVASLALALGSAVVIFGRAGWPIAPLGMAILAVAGGLYAITFAFVRYHRDVTALYFYSLLALVLTIAGAGLALGASRASLMFGAAAVVASVFASRHRRLSIAVQAIVYAFAAVVASGLLAAATLAIARGPAEWRDLDAVMIVACAAAFAVCAARVDRPVDPWGMLTRVPATALLWLMTWIGVGLAMMGGIAAMRGRGAVDPAILSTVRTGILVVAALATAWASRTPLAREAGWLAYPILVLTGLKIVLVDFPQGRPSTLFIALAMYGLALILAGRGNRFYFVSSP